MASVNLITVDRPRGWHRALADRLCSSGHEVRTVTAGRDHSRHLMLDAILSVERRIYRSGSPGLSRPVPAFASTRPHESPDLVIDLSGSVQREQERAGTLCVLFDGHPHLAAAASALSRGEVPTITLQLNGTAVGRAAPMADSRILMSRGLDDILARAITLVVDFVDRHRFADDKYRVTGEQPLTTPSSPGAAGFFRSYMTRGLPRLAQRVAYGLRYNPDHWRVGYRFLDGDGVAEKRSLAGQPWSVLPDRGDRFYADPFPFEWQGRRFIFVEEVVHSIGKGVISVSECGSDGRFGRPRTVLEQPFHMSYPQVFAHDGEIWMIPETGAGNKVSLYRATRFPDAWEEHRVLVADRQIFDATLLEHDGLLWLFGTERDGAGSASDAMVVFFALALEGPWEPHPMNPVLIDKSAARPGGAFVKIGDSILLPLQDGTLRYGGGLGIAELRYLDQNRVELSKPVSLDATGAWPYPSIHTLNRHGRLETIDGLARVARYRKD
jgi:hypothetical protein